MEKASICLLNCGPTGSETLKNLVLGGVGSITVVDGSKVEVGDLGNNFMGMYVLCKTICMQLFLCVYVSVEMVYLNFPLCHVVIGSG